MKINLPIDHLTPEKQELALAEIGKIQEAMDDLVVACQKQQDQLQENAATMEEAEGHISKLTEGLVETSDLLKIIHRVLQSKKDMFKKDKDMGVLLNSLATFVVSSGAIKLGVLSNSMKKEENEATNE